MDTLIIGIGNKARNGKDTLAKFLHKELENSVIMHWADALYKELYNKWEGEETPFPLMIKGWSNWFFLDELENHLAGKKIIIPKYRAISDTENLIPSFDSWFFATNRYKYKYDGMENKDSRLLQMWGTDYKRKYISNNYWVDILLKQLDEMANRPKYVIIPDTRFANEYEAIKNRNGIYIHISRLNKDGQPYLDMSRNPNHPSEIELDEVKADLEQTFKEGDLAGIEEWAKKIKSGL